MPLTKNGKQSDRFACMRIIARVVKENLNIEKYCVVCGTVIKRKKESNDRWNKVKKCSKCSQVKRPQNAEEKFCSFCGKKFHEFDQSNKEKDWNSWYLCLDCKEKNKHRIQEIRNFSFDLIDAIYVAFNTKKFLLKNNEIHLVLQDAIPGINDALKEFCQKSFEIDDFDKIYEECQGGILLIINYQLSKSINYFKS